MKDRECISCERIFDCKGKPTNEPCLCYTPRKKDKDGKVYDLYSTKNEKE